MTQKQKQKKEGAEKCPEQQGPGPSGLPELQQPVLAVGTDQVLVRVVGDADHVLLVHLQRRHVQNAHQTSGKVSSSL